MPVIFPAADGLSFDETEVLLQTIVHSMRVVGMSVACYHPNLDPAGDAAARLASVLVATLTGGPP
jgi:arginase family enzyme